MINVFYTRAFLRQLKKLDKALALEVVEKVELFKNPTNHERLKVHKLHGRLRNTYVFYVTYKVRIFFQYGLKNEVYIIAVDDHDAYRAR